MSKIKLIILLVLVVGTIVLVLQNTQAVETQLFFVTVIMPLAALIGLTTLIGFALGIRPQLLANFRWHPVGLSPAKLDPIRKGFNL